MTTGLRPPSPPPLDGQGRPAAETVRPILFVGDPRRLRFSELNAGYVLAPGMVPDLSKVPSMIRAPEDWRNWRGLYLDTSGSRDVEVTSFFTAHQATLIAAHIPVVILLDARHTHLSPQLSRFANLIQADTPLASIALSLALSPRGAAKAASGHVLVVSAKGGVGKTSVALAVAEYLPRVKVN